MRGVSTTLNMSHIMTNATARWTVLRDDDVGMMIHLLRGVVIDYGSFKT
tara:strand:- start:93 stop:239 length:147 start_codon:yes stop_codon:yes gene_type:complete